ncbi:leucyl aminopeptidase family protein [Amycolatopsis sp. PS_44_ISF1]|uniref:leucyl aminopeptidase family protein n=1 Tax=Amycolatopsis sp. PS_44_ISF1 TaxID=2974917 RepID=UPI0028DDF776|nr:leucyl aminopeptidase family protein [Amycolatopsis sp. PS_44_ISF1]MDT8909428.1 leucyl aminopeptidase family protein [Amycolatopsis sp. PS_44_ISF1]
MRNSLPPVPTKLPEIEVSLTHRRGAPLAHLALAPDPGGESHVEPGAGGKSGDVHEIPGGTSPRWVAGLGEGGPRDYRTAGAALARAVDGRSAQVLLPEHVTAEQAGELAMGLLLGGYRFKVSTEDPKPALVSVRLIAAREDLVAAYEGQVARVRALAAAAALTRDLANTPSNVKNPAWLAGTAAKVVGAVEGVTVTVRDEKWLADNGFGGVLAVGGGSASPPRLIELEYKPRGAASHVLMVGKGITFDTGGLSIKPAEGMHLMRTDMAGGAAVIAAVRAIAELKLPVRVTALVPAAENHVSGSAYRPGDVVRHYGGRTTEVGNTDAEGRMVMADALAYGIDRYRPDVVVDTATLTGAMKVSLGLRTGGLFATDDELAARLVAAGARVGEAWWRMPLVEDYATAIQGELGDVRQAPGGPGAIMAALFLREFTANRPWVHLDIAGPARADKTYDDVVPGASGFASRTLVEFAASYGS